MKYCDIAVKAPFQAPGQLKALVKADPHPSQGPSPRLISISAYVTAGLILAACVQPPSPAP